MLNSFYDTEVRAYRDTDVLSEDDIRLPYVIINNEGKYVSCHLPNMSESSDTKVFIPMVVPHQMNGIDMLARFRQIGTPFLVCIDQDGVYLGVVSQRSIIQAIQALYPSGEDCLTLNLWIEHSFFNAAAFFRIAESESVTIHAYHHHLHDTQIQLTLVVSGPGIYQWMKVLEAYQYEIDGPADIEEQEELSDRLHNLLHYINI